MRINKWIAIFLQNVKLKRAFGFHEISFLNINYIEYYDFNEWKKVFMFIM